MNRKVRKVLKVLLVDDDEDTLQLLRIRIASEGFDVETAHDGSDALAKVAVTVPDVVVTDLRMPGVDGMNLLDSLQRDLPTLPVIMITAHGTIPDAVSATKKGAYGFITKPIDKDELLSQLRNATANSVNKVSHTGAHEIVTQSRVMENLLEKARRAGQANISVLIKGESGTGKELLARFIHLQSGRGGPFVAVNCGAIPENLLESELFGHVKGAFTGANTSRQGLVSLANEGTLFLDELGDMPLTVQAKLLRTLQERKVRPVGSNDETGVDVMVVSATHQDINAMVSAGDFREDLYYRINVVEFTLPPLRERPEDIPLLAQHFLKLATSEESRTMVIAPEAMEVLASQPFKGNVRQLYNVIQRLVAMSSGTVISASQVLDSLGHAKTNMPSFDEARAEFTRQYFTALLKLTGGNVSRAARLADRNRTDFHKLLKKFDIDSSKFKS